VQDIPLTQSSVLARPARSLLIDFIAPVAAEDVENGAIHDKPLEKNSGQLGNNSASPNLAGDKTTPVDVLNFP
jgi:hypothetical protein